jgi:hypothetical protein
MVHRTRAAAASGLGASNAQLAATRTAPVAAVSGALRDAGGFIDMGLQRQDQRLLVESIANSPVMQTQRRQLSAFRNGAPVQRQLIGQGEAVATPAEVIKRATGQPVNAQMLPGTQPASAPRATTATGVVTEDTIRDKAREEGGLLSKVTAMARAEQRILQGADMQKFYDAGHLVGDQLVAGDGTDSFQYWNLAPQVSPFNTPAYAEVENQIRGLAEQGHVFNVTVDVEYPGDYTVTVGDLKNRGIVSESRTPDSEALTIPRRIPTKWKLSAVLANAPEGPRKQDTLERKGTNGAPNLGQPFAMAHGAFGVIGRTDSCGFFVDAQQWAPGESVRKEDIISILSKTFGDLGSPEEIAESILDSDQQVIRANAAKLMKQAAAEVALALLDLGSQISTLKDPTEIRAVMETSKASIQGLLSSARNVDDLSYAAHHLLSAKGWVDALIGRVQEVKEEQDGEFLFSLTQQRNFDDMQPSAKYARSFALSVDQSTPQYQASHAEESDSMEAKRSQLIDMNGKYYRQIETSGGGELHLPVHFGTTPDLLYNQCIVVGGEIVLVTEVTKEVALNSDFALRWIVKYRTFSRDY